MKLRVSEIFRSIQGEGSRTGWPSIFIRLQGCPVGCSFCDTRHTWAPKDSPEVTAADITAYALSGKVAPHQWAWMTQEEIISSVEELDPAGVCQVVITGGEPMAQATACEALVEALAPTRILQIETSGTIEIPSGIMVNSWVTVSPKAHAILQVLQEADELKYVVGCIEDLIKVLTDAEVFRADDLDPLIYLQPESAGKEATQLCVDACCIHGFKLSLQTHKMVGVQ